MRQEDYEREDKMLLKILIALAWLFPLVLFFAFLIGALHSRKIKTGKFSQMIIQITTIGNAKLVNDAIVQIRAYGLAFPYQIWVVTEPWVKETYVGADRVVVVPAGFTCKAQFKARALEYSRTERARLGLGISGVKVLFLDDDTLPTKKYLETAFIADYDVCQGILTPKTGYGRLLSHIDDLRLLNCLVFCSIFQGFGQPLWVHGEGLCVKGDAEQKVTWNWPVFASEDLVFGHMARHLHLSWGWFHEQIHITSPWTLKAFLIQRRRWLWGNIHAFRYILPGSSVALVGGKYILGIAIFFLATTGLTLDLMGRLMLPMPIRILCLVTMTVWLAGFFYAGWENSGKNLIQALISMILAWITSAANVLVLFVVFFWGNPRRFDTIAKVKPGQVQ